MSELYELPDGWEWKKLGNISKKIFAGGDKPEVVSEFKTNELNIPIYANAAKDNGLYGYSNIYKVDEECITISARGTIGFTVVRNEKFLPIVRLIVVIPDEVVIPKILKYYLDYELVENTGSSIPQLTVPTVKELLIPLPPLSEQQRIVSKLDLLFEKIDKSIALHQKNMDEANAFMGSVLNDVFGELEEKYPNKKVDELCTKITDGTHATPKYIENGIPFLSVKNISQGFISFKDTKFISEEEHIALSKRCNVEKNDILYTKVGTTGIAKVVDTDKQFSIFVSIALLKPKKDLIENMYFQHILNSPNCYQQSQSRTRGMANRNLVLKDIKEINFPLPPLPIQQKVVTYLDDISQKIEKIKKLQKEKMASLKALKASILDSAFRGEL